MEYILVLLIVALLNGAIAYIDGLMEGIIPLTLYAEQYMSTLAGVDLFQSLFDIVFGFGVSLIVLKFLKKGFETYVLWSDGDADEEPIAILTNFFKAMAVAICFPTMYDWLATIVEEMSNKMLEAIGLATAYDWAGWVSGISSMGLVTAIFGLVFVIVYFILYFQFLMRGLEILILRVGIPLACVGLIDNDKGVFKPYMSKFFLCGNSGFSCEIGGWPDDEYAHFLGRGLYDSCGADTEVPSGLPHYDRWRWRRRHCQQRIPFCTAGADGQGHGKVR